MERHSVGRGAVIVFAKNNFPASFRQKKLKILNLIETDVTLPIAHCISQALFLQSYLQDPLAYFLAALATL